MKSKKNDYKKSKELENIILKEKTKGISDFEICKKYKISLKFIEKVITRTQGINISTLNTKKNIKCYSPKDFKEEQTTVWSFKQRGNWATHNGEYRGNWSPYIPRNVILKYSKPGDLVLDYFCGSGTTAVEAKLLGRQCIGLDINDKAIELAKNNLNFNLDSEQLILFGNSKFLNIYEPKLIIGDARNLSFLENDSVDLICAHPPYANIIHYTNSNKNDLSFLDVNDFLVEISKVANESFRVLKPGKKCAILIGDTRKNKHVVPLGFKLINVFLDAGFRLKELIIKRQHNCKTTGFWYNNSIKYNFLLLAHEYLPIFEKPQNLHNGSLINNELNNFEIINVIEKNQDKIRLDHIETTTVWVLPENDFENHLNKNVIDRYSVEKKYLTISLLSNPINEKYLRGSNCQKNKNLIFIKSPVTENIITYLQIECYLKSIKQVVKQQLLYINNSGYIVIQTQDIRIGEYIEPLAIKIIETLKFEELRLKEIVVVAKEKIKSNNNNDYLKIIHQYLLVYEINRRLEKV